MRTIIAPEQLPAYLKPVRLPREAKLCTAVALLAALVTFVADQTWQTTHVVTNNITCCFLMLALPAIMRYRGRILALRVYHAAVKDPHGVSALSVSLTCTCEAVERSVKRSWISMIALLICLITGCTAWSLDALALWNVMSIGALVSLAVFIFYGARESVLRGQYDVYQAAFGYHDA